MFIRRQPLSPLQTIKQIFWPSMGFRRAARYVYLRLVRLSDSTHKIAAGLSIGVGISFSPILFTHFIQAGLIAYAIRANVLSALIGTFVGTPWTFPFMWWASISLGSGLFELFGLPASRNLPENIDFAVFWQILTHQPMRIFAPWFVGGYLLGIVALFVTYPVFYYFIKAAKAARTRARLRAIHRVAEEVTGEEP